MEGAKTRMKKSFDRPLCFPVELSFERCRSRSTFVISRFNFLERQSAVYAPAIKKNK
jgi:hypothetical protein